MRMWPVPPPCLCRQHLLGEHKEMHMLVGCLVRHKTLTGYLRRGQLQPERVQERHAELVAELQRRGYQHHSPLEQPDCSYIASIPRAWDPAAGTANLMARCPACRERVGVRLRRTSGEGCSAVGSSPTPHISRSRLVRLRRTSGHALAPVPC